MEILAKVGMTSLAVVIIGKDEGFRLARCLESVLYLRSADWDLELIYVDSRSTDGSAEVAEHAGARVVMLEAGRTSPARGRDAGWRAAASPHILFLDGDCVLHPDFVRRALPEFDDPKVAIVFGHTREIARTATIYQRVLDLDWWDPPPGPAEFCLGNSLTRRSVLEAVDGYDTSLMGGEEPDLCCRLRQEGHMILCLDMPMVAHDLGMTRWSQYWRRGVKRGYAFAEVLPRFSDRQMPVFRLQGTRCWFWGPACLLSPLVIGAATILTGSWFPLLLGIGIATALVLGTAWNCRRRSDGGYTCLLYGIHSHLREVLLFLGQVLNWYDRRVGRKTLIEYKTK